MLKEIAPDIWHVPAPAPLRFPGGLRMPIASTLIRLADRSLVLYSPIALDDATVAEIASQGEVAHIIAPSRIHHLFASAAAARFPRATVHATPGLAARVPALTGARELAGSPWVDAGLEALTIAGAPKLDETVLFHRPSGTLVCADLVFNIRAHAGFMTSLILKMMGVGGKDLAQSRAWKVAVRDRAATRASLDRVLAWPIQRVAPCHGEPVDVTAATLAPKLTRAYGAAAKTLLAAVQAS